MHSELLVDRGARVALEGKTSCLSLDFDLDSVFSSINSGNKLNVKNKLTKFTKCPIHYISFS